MHQQAPVQTALCLQGMFAVSALEALGLGKVQATNQQRGGVDSSVTLDATPAKGVKTDALRQRQCQ
jgi:hypothetical protein